MTELSFNFRTMDTTTTSTIITVTLLLQTLPLDCRLHRVSVGSHLTHRNLQEIKENFTPAPQLLKKYRDVCPEDAVCVPPVQCPAHVRDEGKQFCTITGGRQGVCCTSGQNHTGKMNRYSRGIDFNKFVLLLTTFCILNDVTLGSLYSVLSYKPKI